MVLLKSVGLMGSINAMVGFKKRVFARRKSFVPRKRFKRAVRVPRPLMEVKVVDTPIGQLLSTTPSVQLLNGVANGTGDFQRIGNLINMKYVHLSLWVNQVPAAALANQSDYCRIAIIYDRSPNGVIATSPNIFQATDNAGANTSDPFVKANVDTRHRFRIVYNTNIYLPAVGALALVNNGGVEEGIGRLRINKFLRLSWKPVRFIGATAAMADMESGALYLVTETQTIAVGASTSTLQGSIRVAYGDK